MSWPRLFFRLGLITLFFLLFINSAWAEGDRQHIVYFEGTARELEVYKIFGRQNGPTIMLIGGIQGDEPGGFLSADLYVDLALKRGNLIIVPRANFKSIILHDRGPDGDMNRKFDEVNFSDPDFERVEIIKNLIAESDLMLNLHDGSGFFRPKWENDLFNPDRYGQCIIADADVFTHPKTGKVIKLAEMANKVIAKLNAEIPEPQYKFHFNNHDTLSPNTRYKEQRKSASFYTLTKLGIPAYGVETSKQLPSLEMKIFQHNLAINAFMELFGVIPEQPRIILDPPTLDFMIISVNQRPPVALADRQTITVSPGDTIEVLRVDANYGRGLSIDVLGLGGINDLKTKLTIHKPTSIIARRDNIEFGKVNVEIIDPQREGPLVASSHSHILEAKSGYLPGQSLTTFAQGLKSEKEHTNLVGTIIGVGPASLGLPSVTGNGITGFVVEVDGHKLTIAPDEKLIIKKGCKIKLVAVESQIKLPDSYVLNLKGFVGKPFGKSGDDMGTTADTAKDMLIRFAVAKTPGKQTYQLGAEDGPKLLAAAYVEIVTPRLKSVTLEANGKQSILTVGQRLTLKPGTEFIVKDIVLEDSLPLTSPHLTLGGRPFPPKLPAKLIMPSIAVSLAIFTDGELAGKVVLAPIKRNF
ncbi:MAG: hypothetical protein LBV23_08710 [Deltaproteobacteria bacterium]|jgi:hypothetical protein|nr:hypothetical protein [Deltaproteobacteria bacterium]